MEILFVIVIIFIIIHFFSYRKVKKDIISLKKQISDIESSSVGEGLKPSPIEDIQSDLPTDIRKEKPSKSDIPDIESESFEPPQSVNKNKMRKALILFKRFEHVFIESWIAEEKNKDTIFEKPKKMQKRAKR